MIGKTKITIYILAGIYMERQYSVVKLCVGATGISTALSDNYFCPHLLLKG